MCRMMSESAFSAEKVARCAAAVQGPAPTLLDHCAQFVDLLTLLACVAFITSGLLLFPLPIWQPT